MSEVKAKSGKGKAKANAKDPKAPEKKQAACSGIPSDEKAKAPKPTEITQPMGHSEASKDKKGAKPAQIPNTQIVLNVIREAGKGGMTRKEICDKAEPLLTCKNPRKMCSCTIDPYFVQKGLVKQVGDCYVISDK